jgi:two-component system sensor histidine kinase/response regulator
VDPEALHAALAKWLPRRPLVLAPSAIATSGAGTGPDFAASFAGIAGLDVSAGLRMTRGSAEKYAALLRLFVDHHETDMARLRECRAAGDLVQAERLSHTLKGAAGTVGATGLSSLAAELDAALREGRSEREIEARTEATALALQSFSAAVRATLAALPSAAGATSAPVDTAWVRGHLDALADLLAEGDVRALALSHETAPELRSALGDRLDPLLRQIEAFDFEAALDTLRAARKQLQLPG